MAHNELSGYQGCGLILLLTYKADRRTLVYMTITTALLIVQWNLAAIQPSIYLWFLFMAVSIAIIATTTITCRSGNRDF